MTDPRSNFEQIAKSVYKHVLIIISPHLNSSVLNKGGVLEEVKELEITDCQSL